MTKEEQNQEPEQ